MDMQEVMINLARVCKESKLTWDEHNYMSQALVEIEKRLKELDELKKPKEEEKK